MFTPRPLRSPAVLVKRRTDALQMTHTQPQRTWSKELAEEGWPQKIVMNHPNLVWQFSCTGQDTSRSDWSSQAWLQSKKTSEIRAISGNDRKTWIHDPQRLCSGYCILHEKIPIIFRYPHEKNEDVPDKTIFLSFIGFCLHPHLRINMFGPQKMDGLVPEI